MFHSILVPLDRSALAEQALGQAAAVARAADAEIHLVLAHEQEPGGGFDDAPWHAAQHDTEESYLRAIADELARGCGVRVSYGVIRANAVDAICTRAREIRANLVVMTSHGRTGLSRAWLGSVADGVMRRSSIPVLMLRPVSSARDRLAAKQPFKKILIPLDGSPNAEHMIAAASELAWCGHGRLMLLRVVEPVPQVFVDAGVPYGLPAPVEDEEATHALVDEATRDLARVVRALKDGGVEPVDARVVIAPQVAQAILDCANGYQIDLIAMSTHGRGTSRLLVGSVADKVLRGSHLPVMLQHPKALKQSERAAEPVTTAAKGPALVPA